MKNVKVRLSQTGYEELKKELNDRKVNTRTTIADEIEKARQLGDLSENSAYKSAMEQKDFNEKKISDIEDILKNSEIVENEDTSTVGMGSEVVLQSENKDRKIVYKIVGESEANPSEKKISLKSPIGQALSGQKKGASIVVVTPMGELNYKILSIK